jgi:hypothetical protein
MADYTEVPDVTTGDTWTADNHDTYVRNNFINHQDRIAALEAFVGLETCSLYMSALWLNSTTNDDTYIPSFNNATYEIVDTEGWHDVSTNPDRITITKKGLYMVVMGSQYAWDTAPTTGNVIITISYSGALRIIPSTKSSAIPWSGYSTYLDTKVVGFVYNPSDATEYIRMYLSNMGTSKIMQVYDASFTVIRLTN